MRRYAAKFEIQKMRRYAAKFEIQKMLRYAAKFEIQKIRRTPRVRHLRSLAYDERMAIRAIFYDAGHTLVEPRPGIDELWDFLAHQLGIAISAERRGPFPDVAAFFYTRLGEDGLGAYASDAAARSFWSEYYAYALRDVAPDVPRAELLSAGSAMFDWYNDPAQWAPFPEVLETLRAAKSRGLLQGVVSDWGTHLLSILHAHEITAVMDFVVASAVVGASKPHREIFHYALGRAGVAADETIYVGDSYLADVLGSRAAGLHPVLIDRPGTAPAIDAPVVRSLAGVLDVVDAHDRRAQYNARP